MAVFGKNIFGEINGKLGEFVFRKVNGKNFVSLRPLKYRQTKSIKLNKVRNGFSLLSGFSAYINSINELKKVWSLKQVSGKRAYNKIYSHNNKFLKDIENFSILNILPYNKDNIILLDDISKNAKQISFNIRCLDNKSFNAQNIYTIIIVAGSIVERKYSHQISVINFDDIHENKLVSIDLNKSIVNLEKIDLLFCGVTICGENNNILSWSNTKSILNY